MRGGSGVYRTGRTLRTSLVRHRCVIGALSMRRYDLLRPATAVEASLRVHSLPLLQETQGWYCCHAITTHPAACFFNTLNVRQTVLLFLVVLRFPFPIPCVNMCFFSFVAFFVVGWGVVQ